MGRSRVRELARKALEDGNPTGWFDALYAEAAGDPNAIPWANLIPNPGLVSWTHSVNGARKSALVVGCGLGDDAEELARHGFGVTAFDISAEAIRWAKQRFPDSKVNYQTADLLSPPSEWSRRFDLVFECYTLQSLPANIRPKAFANVAEFVKDQLLILARGRDNDAEVPATPPWPLTRDEMQQFVDLGLRIVTFEDYMDDEIPPTRRFRILYQR